MSDPLVTAPVPHWGALTGFEQFVKRTAFFPEDQAIPYTALAMVGEAGEVANEVKKLIRDDGSVLTVTRRYAIVDECGDVLWYLAALLQSIDSSLVEAIKTNVDKISERTAKRNEQREGDAARAAEHVSLFPAVDGMTMYAINGSGDKTIYLTPAQYADHVAAQKDNVRPPWEPDEFDVIHDLIASED
jgi:NTP pyrophosphatase (non-canonical NTP hydrolase)